MTTPDPSTPRIWLLLSDKLGDNAQVEIIAEALGMSYEIRRVYPLEQYVLGKPPFRPSLYHLDLERSDPLEAPWPDLIITIGRRPSMAAMWVRQQSGGRTRIVLVGRPKRRSMRTRFITCAAAKGVAPLSSGACASCASAGYVVSTPSRVRSENTEHKSDCPGAPNTRSARGWVCKCS